MNKGYISVETEIELSEIMNYPDNLKFLSVFITNDNTAVYKKVSTQYCINKSAFEILSLLDGTHTISELVALQMNKYPEGTEEDISLKIETFIENLDTYYKVKAVMTDVPRYKEIVIKHESNMYPITATIELTHKCNLRCIHCYGEYGLGSEMSREQVLKLLEDLKAVGIRNVELTGGDISVYPYIKDVIQKALTLDFNAIVLLTNGIIMDEEFKQILINGKDKFFMQIDLHSLDDDYMKWFTQRDVHVDTIINNIDYLVKNGVKIRVTSIITSRNLSELPALYAKVSELNVTSYVPSLVTNIGRAKSNVDLFLQDEDEVKKYIEIIDEMNIKYPSLIKTAKQTESSRNNCGCITTNVVITPTGNIKLCAMDNHFLKKLGNVLDRNIKETYDEHKEFIRNMYYLKLPSENDPECKDCRDRLFCAHCFVRAFKINEMREKPCKWYERMIINNNIEKYLSARN